jgi:hypothetical protein
MHEFPEDKIKYFELNQLCMSLLKKQLESKHYFHLKSLYSPDQACL